MLFPAFLIENEITLMIYCGGFIVPIIGFIIPIFSDIIHNLQRYTNTQLFFKFLLLFFCIFLNGLFIYQLF